MRRLAVALTLQALLATCMSEPDLMQQALQEHCGQEGCGLNPRLPRADLKRTLTGEGMHRDVEHWAILYCTENPGVETAASEVCDLTVLQPLPAAVYANIYEIENAAKLGQGPAVKLFGPLDVESIERESKPTVLAVYSKATVFPRQDMCSSTKFTLQLHARYPRPRAPLAAAAASWQQWLGSSPATVELPDPVLLAKCNRTWVQVPVHVHGHRDWPMPAGNTLQGPVVAAVTAAAVLGGAAVVLLAIMRSREGQSRAGRKQGKQE